MMTYFLFFLQIMSCEREYLMKEKKWMWIGQRISDGFLYSRALKNIDVFFSCDDIQYKIDKIIKSFSLAKEDKIFSKKWQYTDIVQIISKFKNDIERYLHDEYNILSYYLSESSKEELGIRHIINEKVFNCQLNRVTQYFLIKNANISLPKYMIPYGVKWNSLVKKLSYPIIMQYDKSSSCSGTFLLESENEYLCLIKEVGEPDIAVEYINDVVSCSSHIYISNHDIIIFSPSVQIITKKYNLNKKYSEFSYKGNDFGLYYKLFGKDEVAYNFLYNIGLLCSKIGIRGLLGVDYMRKQDAIFFTEINFRLQNSTSLLSFLQNETNNVIHYITRTKNDSETETIKSGFQFLYNIKVNLMSGYYSINGDLISSCIDKWELLKDNVYLVFCDKNYVSANNSKNIRIIGLGSCLQDNGNISEKIIEFASILEARYE